MSSNRFTLVSHEFPPSNIIGSAIRVSLLTGVNLAKLQLGDPQFIDGSLNYDLGNDGWTEIEDESKSLDAFLAQFAPRVKKLRIRST